jgi:hypothetical protein
MHGQAKEMCALGFQEQFSFDFFLGPASLEVVLDRLVGPDSCLKIRDQKAVVVRLPPSVLIISELR